jgi:hypothetical protein
MQPLLLITNGFLNVHWHFKFKTEGTKLPATDATNRSLCNRLHLKCDGTHEETRFRLSAKQTSPFKSAEVSVQSTTGSQGVRISNINAGYTMFWGSVKSTGYPLHSPVSPSLPLPCVTVCHHTVLVCNTQVTTIYLLYVSILLGHYQGDSSNYREKCINIKHCTHQQNNYVCKIAKNKKID